MANGQSNFDKMLASMDIPDKIDPALLNLWIERERAVFDEKEGKAIPKPHLGLSMSHVMATYLGVVAMLVTVLLGLLRGDEIDAVLTSSCNTIIFFSGVGFLAGLIAEHCVRESAIALARDVVERSN